MLLAKDYMEPRVLVLPFTVGTIKRSDTRLFLQDAWVVRDAGAALSLSQDELLSTKTMFWVDILQLTSTVSQKQTYRSPKARLVCFETFPKLSGL